MPWPVLTVVFMIASFAIIVGFDVVWAVNKKDGDTISEVMRRLYHKWRPIIMLVSFGMGLLAGHWWW